jgi:hypothetical protein
MENDETGAADALAEIALNHVRFAVASERIGCAIVSLKLPLEFIGELAAADESLAPELGVAVAGIEEACAVLARAHRFLSTRLEVRSGGPTNPHTEGEES